MSTFKEIHQTLQTFERKLAHEGAQKDARIAELGKQLAAKHAELERSQEWGQAQQREKEDLKQSLATFESQYIESQADVAGRIATLKAEQEIIARRDRESRNELDRLQHMAARKK